MKCYGLAGLGGKHNAFFYLSDFSYAERLALYDNGSRYAYINLLDDETYDEFLKMFSSILAEFI